MDVQNMQNIYLLIFLNLVFVCFQANNQEQVGGEVWKRGFRVKVSDRSDEINV